jgi:hypothetical protein
VRRSLRAAGVDTRRVLRSPQAQTRSPWCSSTGAAAALRFRFRTAARSSAGAAVRPLPIDRRTLLLVDGPSQALRAVKRTTPGSDRDRRSEPPAPSSLALLPYVDYPIVPLEFGSGWTGRDPERLLRRLRAESGGRPW